MKVARCVVTHLTSASSRETRTAEEMYDRLSIQLSQRLDQSLQDHRQWCEDRFEGIISEIKLCRNYEVRSI